MTHEEALAYCGRKFELQNAAKLMVTDFTTILFKKGTVFTVEEEKNQGQIEMLPDSIVLAAEIDGKSYRVCYGAEGLTSDADNDGEPYWKEIR